MTFGSTFGRVFSPTFQPKSQAAAAASTFVPTDISGCVLWYDFSDADTMFTDAGTTKVANDGDLIYQINDKSTSGINATQATANKRPAYKTGIQNSLSAGYSATSETYYMSHAYPLGTATDFTIFAAAVWVDNSGTYPGLFGGAWNNIALHTQSDGTVYAGTDVTYRVVTSSGFVGFNTDILISLKKSGTSAGNLSLYKNAGTPVVNTGKTASNPSSATMALFNFKIATQFAMKGYFYEYIIYNTALSDTDRGTVETYLNNKWAIY
jgi:hypothetical protein